MTFIHTVAKAMFAFESLYLHDSLCTYNNNNWMRLYKKKNNKIYFNHTAQEKKIWIKRITKCTITQGYLQNILFFLSQGKKT